MKLKVGHLDYDVLPLPPLWSDAESAVGLHSPTEPALYIRTDHPPAEQARILLHEIIHALFHAHNLPSGPHTEEQICGLLESPLASLFRDNPHLPRALAAAYAGKPIVPASGRTIKDRKA